MFRQGSEPRRLQPLPPPFNPQPSHQPFRGLFPSVPSLLSLSSEESRRLRRLTIKHAWQSCPSLSSFAQPPPFPTSPSRSRPAQQRQRLTLCPCLRSFSLQTNFRAIFRFTGASTSFAPLCLFPTTHSPSGMEEDSSVKPAPGAGLTAVALAKFACQMATLTDLSCRADPHPTFFTRRHLFLQARSTAVTRILKLSGIASKARPRR